MNTLEARRRLLGRNVYKRTTEGNPAIAQGSLARMYPGITMQGWTEQDSTDGTNLIDYTQAATRTENQSVEIIDGGVKWTGDYYFKIPVAGLKKNQNYIMSYESDDAGLWAFSYSDSTSSPGAPNGHSYTTDPEKDCNAVFIYKSDPLVAGQDMVFTNIMLNEGSTVLPYEPYTGGQPSPSPDYPQEIVSAGKYNEDTQKWEYEIEFGCGQLAEDSVVSHPEGEYSPDKIIFSGNITGEYTISLEEAGEVSYTYPGAGIIKITINGKDKIVGKDRLPYTFSGNITEITVFSSNSYVGFTGTIEFMLNPGSTPLPYEPYRTPQTVLITSDRPLTKRDRLEKRNGQWGWVYKSAEVVLDGSVDENWLRQSDSNGKKQFYILLSDALYPYSDPFKEMFYCDTFLTTNNLGAIPKWQVRKGTYNGLAPVFKPSDDIDTVEAFRDFLAENQTTILYVTKEETFIPLSESEQEQMNALHTYYPTTVLSNDCGCNMTLTYKTKKSLEAAT